MRRVFAWLASLATIAGLLIVYNDIITLPHEYSESGKDSMRMQMVIFAIITLALGVTAVRLFRRKNDEINDDPAPAPQPNTGDRVTGSGFDGGGTSRSRAVFADVRPNVLRGRAGPTRVYPHKGWHQDVVSSFHLDYDRSSNDFGDIIVKLSLHYFKELIINDGDDLQFSLSWKRHEERALIEKVANFTSGQDFEPDRVGEDAGLIEVLKKGEEGAP